MTIKQDILLGRTDSIAVKLFSVTTVIVYIYLSMLLGLVLLTFGIVYPGNDIDMDKVIAVLTTLGPGWLLITILGTLELFYKFRNWVDDYDTIKYPAIYDWYFKKQGYNPKEKNVKYLWSKTNKPDRMYSLFMFSVVMSVIIGITYYTMMVNIIPAIALCFIRLPFYIRERRRLKKKKELANMEYIHDGF